MTEAIFTHPETWTGGSYDLGIELGPHDDTRLRGALRALWSHPDLDGVYAAADIEPHEQTRLEAGATELETQLHGIVRITNRPPIACRTVVIRFDDGVDWVYFCLPMGSMARIFDIGAFPFADGGDLAWRAPVDDWLCELGRFVFEVVEFGLGLVGFDGGDVTDAPKFHEHGVPQERWVGYLVPDAGTLQWFPSNRGAPFGFGR